MRIWAESVKLVSNVAAVVDKKEEPFVLGFASEQTEISLSHHKVPSRRESNNVGICITELRLMRLRLWSLLLQVVLQSDKASAMF
jgi:hypothetical protein